MSRRRLGLSAITMIFVAGFSAPASACGCWWWSQPYYVQPAPYVADPYRSPRALAPAPIYVVRQGPYYSGPGVMVPYQTWSPGGRVGVYPYVGPYRYGYRHVYPRRAAVRHAYRHHGPSVAPRPYRATVAVPASPRAKRSQRQWVRPQDRK